MKGKKRGVLYYGRTEEPGGNLADKLNYYEQLPMQKEQQQLKRQMKLY
jgi:GTP cyclohydrolase II